MGNSSRVRQNCDMVFSFFLDRTSWKLDAAVHTMRTFSPTPTFSPGYCVPVIVPKIVVPVGDLIENVMVTRHLSPQCWGSRASVVACSTCLPRLSPSLSSSLVDSSLSHGAGTLVCSCVYALVWWQRGKALVKTHSFSSTSAAPVKTPYTTR